MKLALFFGSFCLFLNACTLFSEVFEAESMNLKASLVDDVHGCYYSDEDWEDSLCSKACFDKGWVSYTDVYDTSYYSNSNERITEVRVKSNRIEQWLAIDSADQFGRYSDNVHVDKYHLEDGKSVFDRDYSYAIKLDYDSLLFLDPDNPKDRHGWIKESSYKGNCLR